MPSFTFIGDEPLSLPYSVMINDKAKQALAKADAATHSSQTQPVASSISTRVAKPPTVSRELRLKLHLQEPGSLGVTIVNDKYCFVTAITNVNQNSSLFQVGDVIISCNGYRYDSMISLEEGEMAWLNHLRKSGAKCFVIQRQVQGGNVAPLKDISNAPQMLCATGSAPLDTRKHEALTKNAATHSSQMQPVASSISTTASEPPTATVSRVLRFQLHLQEPGTLGLTITKGACCTVSAITNVNQNSSLLFQVGDVIISCNGYRYDSLTWMAWVNHLRASGVKYFVVQRQVQVQGGNVAPLKDISNAPQMLCATGSAPLDTYKNESLLSQVELHWRSGKSVRQTSACKAAIRSCLLNGFSPAEISRYVTKNMGEVQSKERKRVGYCVRTIQAAENATPAATTTTTTTTKATGVEDLLSMGIPFQQNGLVYKKGDKVKKRKLLSDEAASIHGKLDVDENVEGGGKRLEMEGEISNEAAGIHCKPDSSVSGATKVALGGETLEMDQAKLHSMNAGTDATAAAASLDNASDTAIITPSNSMEEDDTDITSSGCD